MSSHKIRFACVTVAVAAQAACTTYVVLPEGGGGATSSSTGAAGSGSGGEPASTSSSSAGGGAPSCNDGVLDGDETDVDCGGSCGACDAYKTCSIDADCKADTCTGLKKCSCGSASWAQWPEPRTPRFTVQGAAIVDASTGLTWEANATYYVTWDQAKAYCAGKGAPWRMPTRIELISIVKFDEPGYEIDPAVFTQALPPDTKPFWAAEEYVTDTTLAWIVFFSANGSYAGPKSQTFYVRCVH